MRVTELKQRFFDSLVDGTSSVFKEKTEGLSHKCNFFTNNSSYEERWSLARNGFTVYVKINYYIDIGKKYYRIVGEMDRENEIAKQLLEEVKNIIPIEYSTIVYGITVKDHKIIKEMETALRRSSQSTYYGEGKLSVLFYGDTLIDSMEVANSLYKYIAGYEKSK